MEKDIRVAFSNLENLFTKEKIHIEVEFYPNDRFSVSMIDKKGIDAYNRVYEKVKDLSFSLHRETYQKEILLEKDCKKNVISHHYDLYKAIGLAITNFTNAEMTNECLEAFNDFPVFLYKIQKLTQANFFLRLVFNQLNFESFDRDRNVFEFVSAVPNTHTLLTVPPKLNKMFDSGFADDEIYRQWVNSVNSHFNTEIESSEAIPLIESDVNKEECDWLSFLDNDLRLKSISFRNALNIKEKANEK